MSDRIYLSYRLRGYEERTMMRHFETLLSLFPFSLSATGLSSLRVHALDYAEPPLAEIAINGPPDAVAVVKAASEFLSPDCAYLVYGYWDLWQREREWQLRPSPVVLACFGPGFEEEGNDHLRIELGPDTLFEPPLGDAAGKQKIHSNLQSIVRLSRDLDSALPVESRRLWTESGANFADRLRFLLSATER